MGRGKRNGNDPHRRRPGALELIGIAVLLVAVAVYWSSRPRVLSVSHGPAAGTPIIIGDLQAMPERPSAGVPVTIRVSISADRSLVLRRIAVRIQDPQTGDTRDLEGPGDYTVGTSTTTFTVQTTLASSGSYRYWLIYDQTGGWVALEPFLTLPVR